MDYAATTPVDESVLAAALPYYTRIFYNPASTHSAGQKAAVAVETARERCAAAINARHGDIIFTSGGTEAVNAAFTSVLSSDKKHIVVSAIEHDSVLSCAEAYEKRGYTVTKVMPSSDGIVTTKALEKALTPDTAFVCVMTVNNITGAIQPIKELCAAAHNAGALFFTDAVQAVNSTVIDVEKTGVDMLAVSAHKFYAPKGVGFLYVNGKSNVILTPLIRGGEQERGMRAGTPAVPAIVAMGEAIKAAAAGVSEYNAHAKILRREFINALRFGMPVPCGECTDDILSVVFDGVNGGRLSVALSCAGVCCSVGSACSAGSATPPPTLLAMNVKNADCAVRFSFGKSTTVNEVVAAAGIVNDTVEKLLNKHE